MSAEEKQPDPTQSPEETTSQDESEAREEIAHAEEETEAEATGLAETDAGLDEELEEEEEVEFDLDAQIVEFRRQIEEEPENCIHHYNLGEALMELEACDEAMSEFELALEYDNEKEFSSIIHFSIGNLHCDKLMSGVQSTVVKSSVGLHSAHKPGGTITQVNDEDYEIPLKEFEAAIEDLPRLKADEEIAEFVNQNVPQQIANIYYKWGSDLLDKARQIDKYGSEIKDIKQALKHLKQTLEIDPNHNQANLMVKYAKRMIQEGFKTYDEYGFESKHIPGTG